MRLVSTTHGTDERSLIVARGPDGLKLMMSGHPSVASADITALITNAKGLGSEGPLGLPLQVSLNLAQLTQAEKRDFIKALVPSLNVWRVLED